MEDGRMQYLGQACRYIDEQGHPHDALITAVHMVDDEGPVNVNVIYVTADRAKTDPYGLQAERASSVLRWAKETAAHGRYFTYHRKDEQSVNQ